MFSKVPESLEEALSGSVQQEVINCYNLIDYLTVEVRNYFLKAIYASFLSILKIKFGAVSNKMQCLFAKVESKGR